MTSGAAQAGGPAVRRLPRWGDVRSLAGQSVLIAAVCLVTDAVSFAAKGPGGLDGFDVAVLVGLVAADAALASAPRYAGWVALAHAALLPALALALPGRNASAAGQLVAAYRAGAWCRGRPAVAALVALVVGVLGSVLLGAAEDPVVAATMVSANAVLPWLVGRYTTAREAHVEELRRRREDSLRDARAEVGRAVAREREAIAHDLHDVISHHVGAIGVHAAAARLNLADRDADAAGPVATSLAAVETSSRASMVDLRRLLDLLHGGDGSAGRPGLDQLDELFDGVRSAGLRVAFVVYDDPRPVPAAVDTALYRMTQEMMTNALRHGDGAAVRVELEFGADRVSVTARNRIAPGGGGGRPEADPGSGRGLEGIRRRAEVFDGRATFGPVDDGRYWETAVTVPIGGGA